MLYTKSIKYPRVFDLTSGRTELDSDITSINKCLGLLLTTAKGELFGDPDFGCKLYEMLFDQYSDALQELIKLDIVENIEKFESRVDIRTEDIEITPNNNSGRNAYTITLRYRVKTSMQQNTVDIIVEERAIENV